MFEGYPLKTVLRISWSLAIKNFKTKNASSFLGVLWYLLDPLLMFFILMTIRGSFKLDTIEMFPLYLFSGLVFFNFFRGTTTTAVKAIKSGGYFLKTANFPKISLVLTKIFDGILSHSIEIIVLFAMLIYYGVPFWHIFIYILTLIPFALFIFGVCLFLATIGSYMTDLTNIWRVLTRLLWFATPIFYVARKDNTVVNLINDYNPVAIYLEISRGGLIQGQVPTLSNFSISMLMALASLLIGIIIFNYHKKKFAENIF
jgi:ABC-type polysaccharide/polyol phosphate export permease